MVSLGRIARQSSLFVGGVAAKIASVPAGIGALVSDENGALGKVKDGYFAIPDALMSPWRAAEAASEVAKLNEDYNLLSAREFNEKYGSGVVDMLQHYTQAAIDVGSQFYENLTTATAETAGAALLAFGSLYIGSHLMRFCRQQGRGSAANRLERRFGQKCWKESPLD